MLLPRARARFLVMSRRAALRLPLRPAAAGTRPAARGRGGGLCARPLLQLPYQPLPLLGRPRRAAAADGGAPGPGASANQALEQLPTQLR